MSLPFAPPLPPMEAEIAEVLPEGAGWQYEPKWDGFRCLAFRDGADVTLWSKSGRPLARYFPDVVAALAQLSFSRFVLDGELVVPSPAGGTSFEALQLRLHPAESRVRRLAAERPALYVVFDLLVDPEGVSYLAAPLSERRARLERFMSRAGGQGSVQISPATRSREAARAWIGVPRAGFDGVMAKRVDAAYRSGERTAMQKVKPLRSADCVVGGFRRSNEGRRSMQGRGPTGDDRVGSLLLGLYGADGRLHHVGHTASLTDAQQRWIAPRLAALRAGASDAAPASRQSDSSSDSPSEVGFSGNAPGAPSRWSAGRSAAWEAVRRELVVEVEYRHWSGGRFRHGTHLLRERPDKLPAQCTFEQILEEKHAGDALRRGGPAHGMHEQAPSRARERTAGGSPAQRRAVVRRKRPFPRDGRKPPFSGEAQEDER